MMILSVRLGNSREKHLVAVFQTTEKLEDRGTWGTLGMGSEPRVRFPSKTQRLM